MKRAAVKLRERRAAVKLWRSGVELRRLGAPIPELLIVICRNGVTYDNL
jgi:hypothetical protein